MAAGIFLIGGLVGLGFTVASIYLALALREAHELLVTVARFLVTLSCLCMAQWNQQFHVWQAKPKTFDLRRPISLLRAIGNEDKPERTPQPGVGISWHRNLVVCILFLAASFAIICVYEVTGGSG